MTKFYASADIDVSNHYEERLTGVPSTVMSVPEFFAGIELPENTQVLLSNHDKAITTLRNSTDLRGKRAIIKEYYQHSSGVETITQYRGIIDSVALGLEASLNLIPQDLDVLEQDFPIEKVDVAKFPNAIDLDFMIPYIIGTAKKIPLALILAQETPSVQYQYLAGRGDLTVDVVYRDGLVIKEYTGTAQAGGASTTIKLAASDTRADDFYNDAFVLITGGTGSGQVRRITDYVKSTKVATVDTAWGTIPNATSTYVIREWEKVTTVINSITYTLVEFAIVQRDRDRLYDRSRVSADITGLQTERNPAKAIESILALYSVSTSATAFTNAATTINTIGGLFVDGAVVEPRKLFDVLNEIAYIGRIRLRLNDAREFEPVVDNSETNVYGVFTNDNIVRIEDYKETNLNSLLKTVAINYRRQFDKGEYRLVTAQHTAVSTGKRNEILSLDFIFDKTTADKVTDYLAKRKKNLDRVVPLTLGHEARQRKLGELIQIENTELGLSGLYQIVRESKQGGIYSFDVTQYDSTVFQYTAGSLPSDPVTDARADFSKTPPDAVSNLAVVWALIQSSYTATAKLTWVKPTENYKECIVEYKKSTDSLYNTVGTTTGTQMEIVGLTPGLNYDFRVTSINQFDLLGGVASLLSQLAPGDSTAPSTPTGLVGTGKFGELEWRWNVNPETDIDHYEVEMYTASSGGTPQSPTPLNTQSRSFKFTAQTSSLTSTISRWLRIRAVDFSGNVSAWTSRVSATSNSILQDDVTNHEITAKVVATNAGNITTSPLLTATITARGQPILVLFGCEKNGSAGTTFTLLRNGSQIYYKQGTFNAPAGSIAISFLDTSPGTGSVTYQMNSGNIPTEGISYRSFVLEEMRR